MSFGTSVGDVILLVQLAWKTVQNTRKACGEYDELTQEAQVLHIVLRRLRQEIEEPENLLCMNGDMYKEDLGTIATGTHKVLKKLDKILEKYIALGEQEGSGRKLWGRVRFGNGQTPDLAELRGKLTYYTSAMSLFLNMVTMSSMGRVEKQIHDAGGDLRHMRFSLNAFIAHQLSKGNHEGSVLTAYADDDRAWWKELRRELVKQGFSSSVLSKHKTTIKAYVTEVANRGLMDDEDPNKVEDEGDCELDNRVAEPVVCGQRTKNRDKAMKRGTKAKPKRRIPAHIDDTSNFEVEDYQHFKKTPRRPRYTILPIRGRENPEKFDSSVRGYHDGLSHEISAHTAFVKNTDLEIDDLDEERQQSRIEYDLEATTPNQRVRKRYKDREDELETTPKEKFRVFGLTDSEVNEFQSVMEEASPKLRFENTVERSEKDSAVINLCGTEHHDDIIIPKGPVSPVLRGMSHGVATPISIPDETEKSLEYDFSNKLGADDNFERDPKHAMNDGIELDEVNPSAAGKDVYEDLAEPSTILIKEVGSANTIADGSHRADGVAEHSDVQSPIVSQVPSANNASKWISFISKICDAAVKALPCDKYLALRRINCDARWQGQALQSALSCRTYYTRHLAEREIRTVIETTMRRVLLEFETLDVQGDDKLTSVRKDSIKELEALLVRFDEAARLVEASEPDDGMLQAYHNSWHSYYNEIVPYCIDQSKKARNQHKLQAYETCNKAWARCQKQLDVLCSDCRLTNGNEVLIDDIREMRFAMTLVNYVSYCASEWTWSDQSEGGRERRVYLSMDYDKRVVTSHSGSECEKCKPPPMTPSSHRSEEMPSAISHQPEWPLDPSNLDRTSYLSSSKVETDFPEPNVNNVDEGGDAAWQEAETDLPEPDLTNVDEEDHTARQNAETDLPEPHMTYDYEENNVAWQEAETDIPEPNMTNVYEGNDAASQEAETDIPGPNRADVNGTSAAESRKSGTRPLGISLTRFGEFWFGKQSYSPSSPKSNRQRSRQA